MVLLWNETKKPFVKNDMHQNGNLELQMGVSPAAHA